MIGFAELRDLPQLTKLAHIQVKQIQGFDFDWDHCATNIEQSIIASKMYPHTHYGGVVKSQDGSCIGYLSGKIGQPYWNTHLVATVEYWFAIEEGIKLLDDFEFWAKQNGATEMTMGFSNPERLNRLPTRWLQQHGWSKDTIFFRKDLMHV